MSNDFTYKNRWKFELVHPKYKEFSYAVQSCSLPGLNIGIIQQPAMPRSILRPGDNLDIDNLTFSFVVDEKLKSWLLIWNWIRSQKHMSTIDLQQNFGDATMYILNNKLHPKIFVKFVDIFPISISELQFDHSDETQNIVTASVTFAVNDYIIEVVDD